MLGVLHFIGDYNTIQLSGASRWYCGVSFCRKSSRTVFFQIVTAQTSVFADLIIAVIRQNKVRDEIIAHLTIYAALQNRQLSEGDRIQMQFENSSSLVQL